jgi:hypothetical protein
MHRPKEQFNNRDLSQQTINKVQLHLRDVSRFDEPDASVNSLFAVYWVGEAAP